MSISTVQELKADLTGLFEDILKNGSQLRVRVTGRSMSPFLKGGEVLTVSQVPCHALHRGDIILFRNQHEHPVLHRIIRKEDASGNNSIFFLTKGDAVSTFDDPVNHDRILGKVITVEKVSAAGDAEVIHMDSLFLRVLSSAQAILSLLKTTSYWQMLRRLKTKTSGMIKYR
jgi:signal peptidase I